MANGKTKKTSTKMWKFCGRKKRGEYLYVTLYGMERKKQNSGEYTGSTPAFSATHHAAQRGVQVCTHSRVWINRVRLPVLLVVN